MYEEKDEKLFPVFVTGTIERRIFRIYVRKSQEKKFLEKKLEFKTLIKNHNFRQSQDKTSLERLGYEH